MKFQSIDELTHQDFMDNKLLNNLIESVIKNCIPNNAKQVLFEAENRHEMIQEYGDKAFLDPNNLMYPIINPVTNDFDCGMIYAARLKLRQTLNESNRSLKEKADELFEKCKCKYRVNVVVEDHDNPYDLIELMDTLEIHSIFNNSDK